MILSSDKYDLLLLADWLEEYGSSYDIVKAAAIRNNKYNLNFNNNYKNTESHGNACGYGGLFENNYADLPYYFSLKSFRYGKGFGNGEGFGYGDGCKNA